MKMNFENELWKEMNIRYASREVREWFDYIVVLHNKHINEETTRILVPESIKLIPGFGDDDIGILFNDNKQLLATVDTVWNVIGTQSSTFKQFKYELVKIDIKDRIPGNTYYRTDEDIPDFLDLSDYCKYLGNNKYVYVDVNEVLIDNMYFNNLYHVKKVEE